MTLTQSIREYAADGLTASEIAAEVGATYSAVLQSAHRAGVKIKSKYDLDYRTKAERMKPAEAVEYLCDLVDYLTGSPTAVRDELAEKYGVRLTVDHSRIFAAVKAGGGATVAWERIAEAVYYDRDEFAESNSINVQLHYLRKRLEPTPYRLVTDWGVGLRLEVRS